MERLLQEGEAGERQFKKSEQQIQKLPNVQAGGAAHILPRDTQSDVDLVRSISAGMVLKGYFLTKDKTASAECRQTILQCPENVTLIAPTMPSDTHEFELKSRKKRDEFQHALKNGGHSVAASLLLGHSGASGKASANYKKERLEDTKTKDVTKTNFGSKSVISYVPTKAFTLNENDYKLSPAAVKALTDIEKSLELDKSTLNKKCELFYDKFGSHFYTGTYHFGGIYEKSATVETEEEMSTSTVMNLCQTALGGSIKAGSENASGTVSATYHRGEAAKDKMRVTTESSKVKSELCKIGGPQEVDDFETWKQGLVSKQGTWYIIDRDEMTSGKYEGVWKLIVNTPDFQDPLALALTIMESWEQLSGLKNNTDSFLYVDMIAKLVEDLKSCEFENNDKLLRLLQKLDNVLDRIKDKIKTDEVLVKVCNDDTKDVLQRICELENVPDINFLVEKFLELLSNPRSSSISPVGMVLGNLEKASRQFHLVDFSDDQGLEKLQKDITHEIQMSLQELYDKDMLQFILFSASLVDQETFDYSNMTFVHNLSANDINILIKSTRNCLEDINAFDKTIRGIFDAISSAASLERLHEGLRIVSTKPIILKKWLDYLTKDIRTQNFLEVVARHIHEVEDDRKTKMLGLFTELIEPYHGIRLRKRDTIISYLEKAASCGKHILLHIYFKANSFSFYFILYSENQCISKLDKIGIIS